jgi:branched-chain amino acid aminotransferase
VPIREYDGRIVGSGKRGPVAEMLQAAYFDVVRGANDKYASWLAPVAE